MSRTAKFNPASARRAVARKLAMQALYRWQVNSGPWQDVVNEFAAHELRSAPDVPYRVVINEAVGLAKRFGATDSHKFVNAVLDAAARELRPLEH
jgi:N utilization substance protein B